MDIFEQYMKEVSDLKLKIPKMAKDILLEHKDVIIGLLQGQLNSGITGNGERLEFAQQIEEREVYGFGLYAESTERYWAQKSPYPVRPKRANAPYNFQWTGETFEMMGVDIKLDEFDIFSKTAKFGMLQQLYGREAFVLTDEHNEMINEQMLLPLLEEKLADALVAII